MRRLSEMDDDERRYFLGEDEDDDFDDDEVTPDPRDRNKGAVAEDNEYAGVDSWLEMAFEDAISGPEGSY